ncbi:MAG: undecaprenyl-diphosphate phosphatase [Armatimonadota bacterium]
MTIIEAIIKGLIQGLTEFLPVSSSAHLVFSDHFLHVRQSEADIIFFDVMLHLGTLLAVVVYFRRDLLAILRGAGQLILRPRVAWRENPNSRLFVWLLIGTVPAALAGKLLQDFFEQAFGSVPGTATLLLVTAGMLFWISRRKPGERQLNSLGAKDALWIGVLQAAAILPGISRSGATITAGLVRGLDREAAPRFSFLLSAPIILGGGLLALKDALETGTSIPMPALAAGFIAATVSGYLAVVLLLGMVRRGKLNRFAVYCVVAGLGMLAYWMLLVPKVTSPVAGFVEQQPIFINAEGELGPLHPGQSLQLKMIVDSGMLPLREAYVQLPDGHRLPLAPDAATGEGKLSLASELYGIPPEQNAHPAGETREMWVILRNKWGIQNEVRLRLLVVPASQIDNTV